MSNLLTEGGALLPPWTLAWKPDVCCGVPLTGTRCKHRKFLRSELTSEFEVTTYSRRRQFAQILKWESGATTLVVSRTLPPPDHIDETLLVSSAALPTSSDDSRSQNARWLKPLSARVTYSDLDHCKSAADQAVASWKDRFFFCEEERIDGRIVVEGLRSPQIGALHAALAYWQVTNDPGMIVMPTGTGKTETMLALLVCKRLERLLVIVPSSALRDQIAAKFITLGLLRKFGVVGPDALFPVVGKLRHRLHTPDGVGDYFQSCNVIITTMSIISGCSDTSVGNKFSTILYERHRRL
ncbi:MAG: DEAD/DEAH box helicase family protein [Acidobacteria bacterium]|nr:DEAD/DEAH box helicase family protein [Acidobacteriota bacterium]